MPWGVCPATTPEGHDFPVGPVLYLLETWWLGWTPRASDMALHELFAISGSAYVSDS